MGKFSISTGHKDLFLQTINHFGFLLEDKAYKILSGLNSVEIIDRNRLVESDYGDWKSEIDILFKSGEVHFIAECKQTKYTWIFPKSIDRQNRGIRISMKNSLATESYDLNVPVAWTHLAIELGKDGKLAVTRKGEAVKSHSDVHDHVRKVLKKTDGYIGANVSGCLQTASYVVPIIITNARLLQLHYSPEHINSVGALIDYEKIEELEGLAYNFPLNFIYGYNIKENEMKTVYIININSLSTFISKRILGDLLS